MRVPARILLLLLLALPSAAPAMGLGGLDTDNPTARIPEPSVNHRVTVTDDELNSFEVVKASFDGHIFLTGRVGKAKVSIPFEKMKRVDFVPADGLDVTALVTMLDGQQHALLVKGTTPCFGEAAFGNVTVELRYLRDAVFGGPVK